MAMRRRNGYQPKKRNTGDRQRHSVILMAVEGNNETETLYFQDFGKAVGRSIRFTPGNDTDPVHLAHSLIQEAQKRGLNPKDGDQLYCLVDADVNPNKDIQIERADKIAKKRGARLIVSAPCFEIWFLCHFEKGGSHYASNDDVIAELRRFIPDYQKNRKGIYDDLASKTSIAIQTAKKHEKACNDAGYIIHSVAFSPSTEVYLIAEELTKDKTRD